MSEAIKKIDSLMSGCSPFRFFCGKSRESDPISEVATVRLIAPVYTHAEHAYAESYNETLGLKVYALCERYFTKINPSFSAQIELIANGGSVEFQEELEEMLDIILLNENPGNFKEAFDLLLLMLKEGNFPPDLIDDLRHDFLDLCNIYTDNRSNFQKFIAKAEVFLFFVTKANRLARNLCRVVAALSDSLALQGVVTTLGMGNLINSILACKDMLEALVGVISPAKSVAQRAGAVWNVFKYALSMLEDLTIALHALKVYIKDNEFLSNFSVYGIYFAMAGIILGIAKNVFDIVFYNLVINDITNDAEAKLDYSLIAERWEEKIQKTGKILAFIIKALDPQVLKDLHDLKQRLEKQGYINRVSEKNPSKMLSAEANQGVRYALLGRVTDRKENTWWGLVSNMIDGIAITLFMAAPLSHGLSLGGAGALMVKSTGIGLWRWKQNRDSDERYDDLLAKALGGISHGGEWELVDGHQIDEEGFD
jgi:hypothetical protein